jgi:hypothetical protein
LSHLQQPRATLFAALGTRRPRPLRPKPHSVRYGATNVALIRKSRYIHEESVASRVQLRNPTTVHDRNVAVLHRACLLYGCQGTGSYLNLNRDETYSFLDH